MNAGPLDASISGTAVDTFATGAFAQLVDRVPTAFAVTCGDLHTLIAANTLFHRLIAPTADALVLGQPIATAFAMDPAGEFIAHLDRAFHTGVVVRSQRVDRSDESAAPLICSVWPVTAVSGERQHLVIEVSVLTPPELNREIQREVAERLLLSALREQDSADAADAGRRKAAYLVQESRRLAESLDEEETLAAMGRMSLPYLGDWCIVDTLDEDGNMYRLAIVHPDPAKQVVLERLEGRWVPDRDDRFGLPAALRNLAPVVTDNDVEEVLCTVARDPAVRESLRALGIGPLLTVPLVIRGACIGAVTFVSARHESAYTPEDVQLAENLANRSATALDRARAYGEAVALKVKAESASHAKSTFLSMMSHELRTPLNAIGGYVDLIDLELRGPVTEAQHLDLSRIRSNQRYLIGLITDLLNLTRVDSGHLEYSLGDIEMSELLQASVALVEPLIEQRAITFDGLTCDVTIVARGDREKVTQILVNLLSNAIKFTPAGGRISIKCEEHGHAVLVCVNDTGIGIPADKLNAIFEPFVQVKGRALGAESGVGLGLSISRSLARDMNGDLIVESTLGEGSCFTLSLPTSSPALRSVE